MVLNRPMAAAGLENGREGVAPELRELIASVVLSGRAPPPHSPAARICVAPHPAALPRP